MGSWWEEAILNEGVKEHALVIYILVPLLSLLQNTCQEQLKDRKVSQSEAAIILHAGNEWYVCKSKSGSSSKSEEFG